ncbi:hypothetical protein CUMW_105360 [Citrus unshiu]|uniref:Chorismate-utilising enzyme C-terminal domain-containing protein n=2 Tax=Citrus TaxID=2706 RepID=A0A2H5P5G5_CITUN|nr:hypothetical protein CUMW_105360 [Citrus unshiu]
MQFQIMAPLRCCILVASSPEILTCVKKRKIINQLLGTIRRGKTAKEDLVFEKEILNDEKKCAEHIILVDMQRNNVKKVYS